MLLKTLVVVVAAILALTERTRASDVVDLAAGLIGRPYVWGAEGPK
jgi:cell wall-associated NlpC family hydrolase